MTVRVYIALDDTDVKGGPFGTGKVAKQLAQKLPDGYKLWAAIRHQLPQLPGIPFTSHNSPACLMVDSEGEPDLNLLARIAAEHILGMASPGSDPGVCVAVEGPALDVLTSFGREASCRVVSQDEAKAAATEAGALLKGLGGTYDGIIGSAAAVGLSHHGWYGRLLAYKIPLGELPNPIQVGTLRSHGIMVLSIDRQAFIPMDDDWVETYGWPRPYLWAGQPVLPVIPLGNPAKNGGRWRIVHYRSPLKRYLKPILKPKVKAIKKRLGLT